MKNHHYDALKNVALLWVPALATFVNTVGMVWGIPYTNEVTATIIVAVAAVPSARVAVRLT